MNTIGNAAGLVSMALAAALGLGLSVGGCSSDNGRSAPFAAAATTAGATSATSAAPTSPGTTTTPTGATTGTTAPGVTPGGPTYVVSGWQPYWEWTDGDVEVDRNTGNGLDEVNVFGMGLRPDGTLTKKNGVEDPARIAMIRARGGEVIPTIYDVDDGTALASVLASAAYQARAIQEILAVLDGGNYDGIDIDFEHAKTNTRDAFSRFVADLGAEVQARGKVYSVTIPGKWRDTPSWTGYDYAALGAAADRVKIMTYGYSGPWTSTPGPIAPVTWIKRVLDYAITVIPAHKIQLGIPFYGYDWPADGSRVRSVTYPAALDLIQQHGATVHYDASYGESRFEYTDANGVAHTVWFSDARSVGAKAAQVKAYGLRGLSIWALGYGRPALWDAIRAELKAVP